MYPRTNVGTFLGNCRIGLELVALEFIIKDLGREMVSQVMVTDAGGLL